LDLSKGITIAAAKYSSDDVGTLVQYTVAIIDYCQLYAPLKAALARRLELDLMIEEMDQRLTEADRLVCLYLYPGRLVI